MVFSDKNIAEFQRLYQQEFGEEISKEEAYTQAVKLIRLVQVVYKPITKEQYEKYR